MEIFGFGKQKREIALAKSIEEVRSCLMGFIWDDESMERQIYAVRHTPAAQQEAAFVIELIEPSMHSPYLEELFVAAINKVARDRHFAVDPRLSSRSIAVLVDKSASANMDGATIPMHDKQIVINASFFGFPSCDGIQPLDKNEAEKARQRGMKFFKENKAGIFGLVRTALERIKGGRKPGEDPFMDTLPPDAPQGSRLHIRHGLPEGGIER